MTVKEFLLSVEKDFIDQHRRCRWCSSIMSKDRMMLSRVDLIFYRCSECLAEYTINIDDDNVVFYYSFSCDEYKISCNDSDNHWFITSKDNFDGYLEIPFIPLDHLTKEELLSKITTITTFS